MSATPDSLPSLASLDLAAPYITEYAKRYGKNPNVSFLSTWQSGVTPITFLEDSAAPTSFDLGNFRAREKYQRASLRTFSTWELEESGCLSKSDAKPADFSHNIHPLLGRKRWERNYGDQIGDGTLGRWNAGNDLVWKALKPILLLTTRILQATPMWLWFDGMINSEWTELDRTQFNDGGTNRPLYGFRSRKPEDISDTDLTIKEIWTQLEEEKRVRYKLGPATTRTTDPKSKMHGHTMTRNLPAPDSHKPKDWIITFSYENLRPLLDTTNLTVADALKQQFFIVKILIHELTHVAVNYVKIMEGYGLPKDQKKFATKQEPFFEDEETNECGRSAENAIFGGHIIDAWRPQFNGIDFHKLDGWYIMALYTENWVNHKEWKRKVKETGQKQRYRFRENFEKGAICEYWPIQVEYIEKLFRTEYWEEQERKFQTQSLKPDRIFGHHLIRGKIRRTSDGKNVREDDNHIIALGPKYDAWVKKTKKHISTLDKDEYREKAGKFGSWIPADENWRPSAMATMITAAMQKQSKHAKRRKKQKATKAAGAKKEAAEGVGAAGPSGTQPTS